MGNYIEACCNADTRLQDHFVNRKSYTSFTPNSWFDWAASESRPGASHENHSEEKPSIVEGGRTEADQENNWDRVGMPG